MRYELGQRDGGESAMNVAKGLGIGFGGPTAVHLMGTFSINNFGGLGGGGFADEDFADQRVDGFPVKYPWSLDREGQRSHLSTVPFSAPIVSTQTSPTRRRRERALPYAAFSPNSLVIVTAGDDGNAREWDANTGQTIGEPLGLPGPVTQAAFSPDGRLIVAADQGLVGDTGRSPIWPKQLGSVRRVQGVGCRDKKRGMGVYRTQWGDKSVFLWPTRSFGNGERRWNVPSLGADKRIRQTSRNY